MQVFHRVGNFTGPMLAAIMLSNIANFYVLIGGISIAAGIVMFLSVYETRGRSLERLSEELAAREELKTA
jgi:hypothetical protein